MSWTDKLSLSLINVSISCWNFESELLSVIEQTWLSSFYRTYIIGHGFNIGPEPSKTNSSQVGIQMIQWSLLRIILKRINEQTWLSSFYRTYIGHGFNIGPLRKIIFSQNLEFWLNPKCTWVIFGRFLTFVYRSESKDGRRHTTHLT
jgi:hypothetical protein